MSSNPGALKNFEEFEKNFQLSEHFEEKHDSDSFGATDGDEALQLVGAEAKGHFSDEFNRKLRRKLVCKFGALQISVCQRRMDSRTSSSQRYLRQFISLNSCTPHYMISTSKALTCTCLCLATRLLLTMQGER
ncbi:hypothetical protein J3R82DRAFT_4397 [Butyriboletus roseoflavus]|nr:hypothetical protein J3R82DRAFT_4397 [Butyriboletus roseoflavus]